MTLLSQIITWIGLVLAFIPGGIGIELGKDLYVHFFKRKVLRWIKKKIK